MRAMPQPDWQVTATTVKCDAVGEEITIMVYPDGSARCASYPKFSADSGTQAGTKKRTMKTSRTPECGGPLCRQVTDYRDKIMAEELPKS
jgi:hypothetical protein